MREGPWAGQVVLIHESEWPEVEGKSDALLISTPAWNTSHRVKLHVTILCGVSVT